MLVLVGSLQWRYSDGPWFERSFFGRRTLVECPLIDRFGGAAGQYSKSAVGFAMVVDLRRLARAPTKYEDLDCWGVQDEIAAVILTIKLQEHLNIAVGGLDV